MQTKTKTGELKVHYIGNPPTILIRVIKEFYNKTLCK